MIKQFFSIGEALIDFIPSETGVKLKQVTSFTKKAGGAPANVCAAVAKQKVSAAFIGKVGKDAFGEYLIDTMAKVGVDTKHVFTTKKANTSLAFVSLKEDGEREFSFYRKPGADMLLEADEIESSWFSQGDFLHFCSVDLVDAPVKMAHAKAIKIVKQKKGTIVFDPNLRFALWEDKQALKDTVWAFMPKADILKISDNELSFIFDTDDVNKAAQMAFKKGVHAFVYTMGKEGARLITKDIDVTGAPFSVKAVDTTGAGDAFIGGFVAKLMGDKIDIDTLSEAKGEALLDHANACGAIVASKYGAIAAMPTLQQIEAFTKDKKV